MGFSSCFGFEVFLASVRKVWMQLPHTLKVPGRRAISSCVVNFRTFYEYSTSTRTSFFFFLLVPVSDVIPSSLSLLSQSPPPEESLDSTDEYADAREVVETAPPAAKGRGGKAAAAAPKRNATAKVRKSSTSYLRRRLMPRKYVVCRSCIVVPVCGVQNWRAVYGTTAYCCTTN